MWLKIIISLTERSKEGGDITSRTRDMKNHDIILVVGSRTNLDRRSKKDTWRKIIPSLTGKAKEQGVLTSRTRDMRNREII
jgi:hypothetical protein